MEISEIQKDIQALDAMVREAKRAAVRIEKAQAEGDKALSETADFLEKKLGKSVERDKFLAFFKKPYAIIPNGKN